MKFSHINRRNLNVGESKQVCDMLWATESELFPSLEHWTWCGWINWHWISCATMFCPHANDHHSSLCRTHRNLLNSCQTKQWKTEMFLTHCVCGEYDIRHQRRSNNTRRQLYFRLFSSFIEFGVAVWPSFRLSSILFLLLSSPTVHTHFQCDFIFIRRAHQPPIEETRAKYFCTTYTVHTKNICQSVEEETINETAQIRSQTHSHTDDPARVCRTLFRAFESFGMKFGQKNKNDKSHTEIIDTFFGASKSYRFVVRNWHNLSFVAPSSSSFSSWSRAGECDVCLCEWV